MGYTHYMYLHKKEIPIDIWTDITLDFLKVLPKFKEYIDMETDEKLEITADDISFNGIGEEAHETAILERVQSSNHPFSKGKYFEFCKTARKDYDIGVMLLYMIAKKHLKEAITICSDGSNEPEMWENAKIICHEELGYNKTWTFDQNGEGDFK